MILNLYNISILILSTVYVILNFYYNKPLNIVIFTSLTILLLYFNTTLINSIIIAYILSVIFGIIKNFHLLENFDQEYDIKHDSNLVKNKPLKKQKSKLNIINKQEQQELKDNILRTLDSNILKMYVQNLKEKNINITKKKVDVDKLNPIKDKLNNQKLNNMINKIDNSMITVTKDLFILDGHHRWFSKKALLNKNLNYNVNIDKEIDVLMIDMNINQVSKDILKYKQQYNKKQFNSLNFDKSKVNEAKLLISNIKHDINKLELYYQDMNNLKLI